MSTTTTSLLADSLRRIEDAETALDMADQGHPLPGPAEYLATIALSEARSHGAEGWSAPGCGLWRDRVAAGKIGARWVAVYHRLVRNHGALALSR